MTISPTVRSQLLRVFLVTLVMLFLIPGCTLAFTRHVQHAQDADFVAFAQRQVAGNATLSPDERRAASDFYRNYSVTASCASGAPEDRENREAACSPFSMLWQFHWAERIARWTLVLGGTMLATALALGGLAFANRRLRYRSFVVGWHALSVSSAIEVVAQSVLLVWLSFWVTGYFWQKYYLNLVSLAGLAAAAAAFFAVYTLFKQLPSVDEVAGELVADADAPRLWARIRHLAARMGAAPPDQIVAGIDANFFVTEAPCEVGGRTLEGRTLYVSIPLLRVLDPSEADAVLAHELAHLAGGDAHASALLGPKLLQFDRYTWTMRHAGLTIIAHYLLRFYRMIFEFALARDSRNREHLADRLAADATAPGAIVHALIKISAYARYRQEVEEKLFAQNRQHDGALGIATFVARGLSPYARSDAFLDAMKTAAVPHPYDSHPGLAERMRNVGHPVAEQDYGAIVATLPAASWADDIETADAIEQRLWASYERQFRHDHDTDLAYRYEPANDEERALVLQHFPPVSFALKDHRSITVTYAGLESITDVPRRIAWDEVKDLRFRHSLFGETLTVVHPGRRLLRARTTKLPLRGLRPQRKEFERAVGAYWHRHQVMRALQGEQAAPSAPD